ncbi:MAG: 2-C-methyl-D-erythritol 4-phosphate cytidylyltransferase [Candidatus Omnitrophota bacterium]|nr:2-C-methyl-D-erythritol 4-phosphate cytidylyltransferase [Candidatus Omnitrophota bacterium]
MTAIVVAAGKGRRFRSKFPKLLSKINSVPVITCSLKALDTHPLIKDIIVVVSPENEKLICNEIKITRFKKIKKIVGGGRTRQDSVRNGLAVIGNRTDMVLIHDAARPFINKDMISLVIKEAKKSGASCLGVPVKATIKSVKMSKHQGVKENMVEETLDRSKLWEAQTPQVFRKELILKAYSKAGIKVTDDASLVERLGVGVRMVMGSYFNIKITTPEDLIIARAIPYKSELRIKS